MDFRLRNALENLADAELAEARSALNDELGALWNTLAETEQSLLATELRLMTQSGSEAFAALSFAKVVEQELRQRLYLPLRKYLVMAF